MFQSTRPAWGATTDKDFRNHFTIVSIHAPRVGRDLPVSAVRLPLSQFQSTRPAWGATRTLQRQGGCQRCFNPRAPRGARLAITAALNQYYGVSIHAPRVGRDNGAIVLTMRSLHVSIHAPRVGRDGKPAPEFASEEVSIHAPRVGRDRCKCG